MTGLVGRDDESRRLLGIVDALAAVPGPGTVDAPHPVLVVVGEAGVGKTTLLAVAEDHAARTGVAVLRADGCDLESELSLSALTQLLAPVAELVDELPEHLRPAAAAALGLGREPAGAPVPLAVLHLLARRARHGPVLLVVDDVDRLDRGSLRVLLYVARRIRPGGRVGMLLAGRGEDRPLPGDAAVPTLVVPPLPPEAAEALLEGLPDRPAGRVRFEILGAAQGNPLAIEELSAAGSAHPPALSGRGGEQCAARLRAVDDSTRRLLLHAAVADGEPVDVLMAAAGGVVGLEGWAPAERAGLVALDGATVVFRHPMLRAAASAAAPAEERRQAHLALAAAGDDPERIAWHRAHACLAPDEDVAAPLAVTAEAAAGRGDHQEAARAWERAAECSPDPASRLERHANALRAAYAAGDSEWVADQHRVLTGLTANPTVQVVATLLHAAALMLRARHRDAVRLMREGARVLDDADPASVVLLTSFLRLAADFSGLDEHRAAAAELLRHPALPAALEQVTGAADSPADLMWERAFPHDRASAARVLEEALRAGRAGPQASADDLQNLGWLADRADDVVRGVELFARAHDRMHHEGPAAFGVPILVALLVDHGRWTEADALLDHWGTVADSRRMHRVAVELAAPRAVLRALRGDPAAAHEVLAHARARVDLADNLVLDVRLRAAGAVAAMVEGDRAPAYRRLRGAFTATGLPRHITLSPRLVARLAEAATGADERADAAVVVERVREAAGERTSARLRLLLHHADALLGDDRDVERHFRLALADPTGEDWPVERALARLHYGEWLRRRRRAIEAREMLTASLETFESLGATALADRVRAELRASGSAEHRTVAVEADPLGDLTAQQREIVRLAAGGLRNREIAERLFLSPRTVGSHLHHAYPKLGISGRHQLASLLRDE